MRHSRFKARLRGPRRTVHHTAIFDIGFLDQGGLRSASRMRSKRPRFFSSLLLLFITATHAYSQTVTFSGRVTDTSTGLGIPDVAVVAVGNQTGTRVAVTNTNGDYTIEMGTNTNVKIRAYRKNFSFNPVFAGFTSIGGPLTGSHPLNFTGTAFPFAFLIFAQAPVLLTEDSSLHALALDSLFLIRDPFPVVNTNYFGSDKHTRIKLMLVDLDLFNGETVSIISVQGIDNSAIVHNLAVEDLRVVPGTPWLTQLTVRAPEGVATPNVLAITVTVRGLTSNAATVRLQ